ncbi:MAG TPA: TadE/TadG family type IV pilus assembly protein, partial [Stellaceae bacterium]|nr:TadE/TadG family type IV pilus assembly protein [Stellaceae bacterium]
KRYFAVVGYFLLPYDDFVRSRRKLLHLRRRHRSQLLDGNMQRGNPPGHARAAIYPNHGDAKRQPAGRLRHAWISIIALWANVDPDPVKQMTWKQPRRGAREGATAVETAIVIAVLMTLIFGIIEFGMALWQLNTMELAVQQAGRWALINNTDASLVTDTEAQMIAILPSASTTCTGVPAANQICISASTTAGVSPAPSTMTLTASYGFNVLGITGTQVLTSQATVPLI